MKKACFGLCCFLIFATLLYPACVLLCHAFGYSFELVSMMAFTVSVTLLSVGTVVLCFVSKEAMDDKWIPVLMAILPVLSLVNGIFCILTSRQILVAVCMAISVCCACCLAVKLGKPRVLKIIMLAVFSLLMYPVGLVSFIAVTPLGNLGQNTVVKTVESPSGRYYAELIDSDQGALGGDTIVDVYENKGVDLFLIKIGKQPRRVYVGEWGEFEYMEISWEDDDTLLIDGRRCPIE